MTSREWGAALRLMRPRQWPILTGQLAVGILLAGQTGSGSGIDPRPLVAAWMSWVVLLNGGTLAFNSAFDRDTGPVAYLDNPPLPPSGLAGVMLGLMILGAVLGTAQVSGAFGAVTALCVVLSWLYSHPRVRWKGRPGLDLLVNMVGYGAGTTAAGLLAGAAARGSGSTQPPDFLAWISGFGLLFGSLYPLTQIYQLEDDRQRGDRTLTTALGLPRVLDISLILGVAAAVLLMWGSGPLRAASLPLAAGLILWCGHILAMRRAGWAWTPDRWKRAMYHALVLWAVVDIGCVLASRL